MINGNVIVKNEVNDVKILKELLQITEVKSVIGTQDKQILDITADSREVKEGSLFVCLTGVHVDGHSFAKSAAEHGAAAILAEKPVDVPEGTTVIYVGDVRKAMEDITPYFFDYPSRKMRMIGVTGTNGKTTSTHIIAHILRNEGYKVGVIGTIHWLIDDEEHPIHNTTPDVITLQKILYTMANAGVKYVSMEVSSHALSLNRVAGCEFDTAVFTNLTEDHLDYHKTMENYAKAKSILFQMVSAKTHYKNLKAAVVNTDDPWSSVMSDAAYNGPTFCPIISYGIEKPADLQAVHIKFTSHSASFDLKFQDNLYPVHTNLAGRFNVYNTLAAMASALAEGVHLDHIIRAISTFRSVPGRFELINEGQPFAVVVDYAHTPDGLENILKTAREITKGRIITVFGCGGDRDRKKRPIMGGIAARYSDIAVVTSDNPRSEDPKFIVSEVVEGVKEEAASHPDFKYEVLVDRREAIQRAIALAEADDIVLIAGKGHETYQILRDKTIHFDDREEARKAIRTKLTKEG
jgi:UDP-N-acetylmuramoyl-L-alanyl-D-glutamate--2,6-diaminopimelate ligase